MMAYTNSPLVVYTKLSPCNSGQRTHVIDRFTPHCVVGQCSAESLGSWFAQASTKASSNYGIDKDGRIAMYVPEGSRAWTTSSSANDNRAVTVECASDTTHPYAMHECVFESLLKLLIDICKRNGKTKVIWNENKAWSLNYTPAPNEILITVHRWYANKACPGDWLYNRLGELRDKANAAINASESSQTASASTASTSYPIVRKGSSGEYVKLLQQKLNWLGSSLETDGIFGNLTLQEVINFQKKYNLDVDGIVGPQTWSKLDEEIKKKEVTAEDIPRIFVLYRGKVTASALNFREGPGTQYKNIGEMPLLYKDTQVDVLEEVQTKTGSPWLKIRVGNKYFGYVSKSYIQKI